MLVVSLRLLESTANVNLTKLAQIDIQVRLLLDRTVDPKLFPTC